MFEFTGGATICEVPRLKPASQGNYIVWSVHSTLESLSNGRFALFG